MKAGGINVRAACVDNNRLVTTSTRLPNPATFMRNDTFLPSQYNEVSLLFNSQEKLGNKIIF